MIRHRLVMYAAAFALAIGTPAARADLLHLDILLQLDTSGKKLVTGWYNDVGNARGYPQRVFAGDLEETFDGGEPGVRAVDELLPAGTLTLPSEALVTLDLMPMTIGSTTSNLFYWNGEGDVDFKNVNQGTTLEITAPGGYKATADGTDDIAVSMNRFDKTGSTGTLHRHPVYFLDGTTDEGFYLISLRFGIAGYEYSDPAYLVFATSGADEEMHEVAVDWVNNNLANVPEPSTFVLGALQVVGLIAWRRRRSRAVADASAGR